MNRGNARKAIDLLQGTAAFELGANGTMQPVYARGLAYLRLRDAEAATREFRKMIDHPGLIGNNPIAAFAHLQLARAYELSGDRTKAISEYQDFLALWKDADPDIAILKQAKSEYAMLASRSEH